MKTNEHTALPAPPLPWAFTDCCPVSGVDSVNFLSVAQLCLLWVSVGSFVYCGEVLGARITFNASSERSSHNGDSGCRLPAIHKGVQRRSLGNASCPRSGANSTEGAMNRTAQRTRLCSQSNPQTRAWWPELLGPGVRSPTVLEVSGLLVDPSTSARPKEAGLG